MENRSYLPALRFHVLTRLYDQVVALLCREGSFKPALVSQVALQPGQTVLVLHVKSSKHSLTAQADLERRTKMKMAGYLIGMLALPASLVAGPCDFQANGDPRNGLAFKGQVHVPGLSVQSALGQLRRYALEGGFQLGQDLINDSSGELSFIQATNKPALVVWAKADSSGRVSLSMKLARGQKVEPAAVEKEFCSMLAKLKTGEEGEAIAAEARAKSGSGRPIDAQAVKLSQAIGKEVEKAISPVTSKYSFRANFLGYVQDPKEMAGLFEPIRLKYLGQKYRIDGQVFRTNRHDPISFASDLADRKMEITFDVRLKKGLIGKLESPGANQTHFQIKCLLAKDQGKFFQTLTEGDSVTLTGTITEFGRFGMVISDAKRSD